MLDPPRPRSSPLTLAGVIAPVWFIALVISGLFSWRMIDGVPTETGPHVVGAILAFVGVGAGFIALSRRMRVDARWRSTAPFVLFAGVAMLVLFVVLAAFAIEKGTPLHPWVGLLQRVVILLWFACTATIASKWRHA